MKKTVSLLTNLLLSSTLYWDVQTASAEEVVGTEEGVVRIAADSAAYCHMKFPHPPRHLVLGSAGARPRLHQPHRFLRIVRSQPVGG
jgi:hypothetical protein